MSQNRTFKTTYAMPAPSTDLPIETHNASVRCLTDLETYF